MMRFLEVNKIKTRYLPLVTVKMRIGGTSNKNLKNVYKQNLEILDALKKHSLGINPFLFFINKFYLRTLQFLKRTVLEKKI